MQNWFCVHWGMVVRPRIGSRLRASALVALLLLCLSSTAVRVAAATPLGMPLPVGCSVLPNPYPDGTMPEAAVGATSPTGSVTSLWQFDNGAKAFRAAYFRASAGLTPPIDTAHLNGALPLIVCVDSPAMWSAAAPSAAGSAAASLNVQVEFLLMGGAAPPPGTSPHVGHRPAPGLQVRVVPVGDASAVPVASGVTDNTGALSLQLPAGSSWVFVPLPADNPGAFGQPPPLVTMPDGTRVLQWAQVDVPSGGSESVTLSIPLELA